MLLQKNGTVSGITSQKTAMKMAKDRTNLLHLNLETPI